MSLDNLVNSQRVYSQQIQKDVFTSNVGVNVDPVAVYPKPENTAIPSAFFQNRFEVRQSGNLVAEDDLSDLNLANLTVGGEIRVPIVKADDIILNGGSLANELLQGFLTTPLQVNIDGNGKSITNVSQINSSNVVAGFVTVSGALGVETDKLTASSGNSLAIVGTGININGGGGTSGDLILNVSDTDNAAIDLLFNQASGSTGLIPTTNTIEIGANAVNSFTGTQPKNQKVVIGTAPNGVDDGTQGPVNTIITIGSVGTASLPANKEQNRLVFFAGSGVTSTTGGTNPDEQAAVATPDEGTQQNLEFLAGNQAVNDNSRAIEIIARILGAYGLINP